MTGGPQRVSRPRKILWAGHVREHSIPDRLRAAAEHGYAAIAVSPDDVRRALDAGLTYGDLRSASDGTGVAIEHLDPIATWTGPWKPADDGWQGHGLITDFLALKPDEFFAMADGLAVRSITALGSFPQGAVGDDELTECFGRLCDVAATREIRVDLEFIPFWGIPDLDLAWRIVSGCGRANAAVGIDLWHYYRGRPDDELLRMIPPERIGWVQVSDASLTPRVPSVVEDCLFHRVHPGQGAFPVGDALSLLAGTGALRLAGPEIFSHEMDELSIDEAVRRADQGFEAALAAAGLGR